MASIARADADKQRMKLLTLRPHLLPEDACEFLAIATGTQITPRDLWSVALHGRLTVSLEFVEPGHGRRGRILAAAEAAKTAPALPSWRGYSFNAPKDLSVNCREVDRHFIVQMQDDPVDQGVRRLAHDAAVALEDGAQQLVGVWDLMLAGDGRNFINSLLETSLGRPRCELEQAQGTFLTEPGVPEFAWELQEPADDGRPCTAVGVPSWCRVVFRVQELERFLAQDLRGSEANTAKQLRLDTALAMLGALLKKLDLPQESLIVELEGSAPGFSRRSLGEYFAAANKQLKLAQAKKAAAR